MSKTSLKLYIVNLLSILLLLALANTANGQFQFFKDTIGSLNPYNIFGNGGTKVEPNWKFPQPPNYFGNGGVGVNPNLKFPPLTQFQPPPRPQQPFDALFPPRPDESKPTRNTDSIGLIKPCSKEAVNGQLFNGSVTPCVGDGYCTLVRGTNTTLEFEFTSTYAAKSLYGKLSGQFGWFLIPFGSAEDLCTFPGISCPIEPGAIYKVQKRIWVDRDFPSLELDTKIQVYGDQKGDIGCAMLPIKIA